MSTKLYFLTLLLHVAFFPLFGQQQFDVGLIPDSLRENADVVVRFYDTEYQRVSKEKFRMTVSIAVTVFNPSGKKASHLDIYYNENTKVSDIAGQFFDGNGRLLAKLNDKKIRDYAVSDQSTLFSDLRVKSFNPAINQFPFTAYYTYTIEQKGVVGFEIWLPQKFYRQSVEQATLCFSTPISYDIKYKSLNYSFQFYDTIVKNEKTYCWQAKNMKAREYEPFSPHFLDINPSVLLSPNLIAYEGTEGDFSSWQSYGLWTYGLLKGLDEIDPETIETLKTLTDSLPSVEEKTKAIYHYMQKKTRYVNIALGLGGFQPVAANIVDSKGYGDCKALSNYTKSLLQSIGIESFYTEIGSGDLKEIKFPDFASANQTNHIILCVPNHNDTIWLECTNQNIPFGYISADNMNRYALLITPEGGILTKTPSFETNQNTRNSFYKIALNEDGSAQFSANIIYENYLFEEVFGLLNDSRQEQKTKLLKRIRVNGLTIDDFELTESNPAEAILTISGSIPHYATKTASMLFLQPVSFFDEQIPEPFSNKRKTPVYVKQSVQYVDHFELTLPTGYKPAIQSDTLNTSTAIGSFQYQTSVSDSLLVISRNVKLNDSTYRVDYLDIINEFLETVKRVKEEKIILRKK